MNFNTDSLSKKITVGFIFLVFTYLIGLACWAPFERINSDAGYYFFRTINKGFFHVEHSRFVLIVAEILPLIGSLLHLSLKVVVLLYSLNHVLFFAISAFICFKVSNKLNGSLTISLLGFCGLQESVFTPQFELYYGLVFIILTIVLWNSWFENNKLHTLNVFILFITTLFAITSHPMGLFCFGYTILLNEIYFSRLNKPLFISLFAIFILYILWKKLNVSDYEGGKFNLYWEAIKSGRLKDVFSLSSLKNAAKTLFQYYPDIIILGIVAFIFWIKKSAKIGLPIYLCGLLFFPLSVWLQWNTNTPVFRYVEQAYYPFVFSVIIFVLWIDLKTNWLIPILFLSFIYRIYGISKAYNTFHYRTIVMDSLIDKVNHDMGNRFIAAPSDMGTENYNQGNWSYGFETMVRSKLLYNKCITITKEEDIYFNKNDSLLKNDEYLFRMWEREKTSTLNQSYFNMQDGEYKHIFQKDSVK